MNSTNKVLVSVPGGWRYESALGMFGRVYRTATEAWYEHPAVIEQEHAALMFAHSEQLEGAARVAAQVESAALYAKARHTLEQVSGSNVRVFR